MAAEPLIALKTKVGDVGQTFSNALLNIGRIGDLQRTREEAPLRARLLEAQTGAAEQTAQEQVKTNKLKSIVTGAIELNRLPQEDRLNAARQRRAQLIEQQKTDPSISTEDTDLYINKLETDDAAGAQQLLDQTIQAGQRLGILEPITGAAPTIKAGIGDEGKPGFFAVTPTGAERIPGIAPAAKAPLVQIGGGGATEQKELAKLRAQDLNSIRAKGSEAEQQLNSLDILDAIEVKTGAAEPVKQALAGFAEGFGVDASGLANVAAGQSFTAEAGKVVLRVLATQKGPQTDNDRRNIAKTISRLGNTPEANIFINDAARAVSKRAIEQRDFFDNYLGQNDTLKGASSAWNKQKKDIPMISRSVKTPDGLPVFFFKFEERVMQANPDATRDQIIEAWTNQEQAAKARK